MGLDRSPQSSPSRWLILLSIYSLILLAVPFAYKLTAVQRLPIDAQAIRKRAHALQQTGCVVRIPTAVYIEGISEAASSSTDGHLPSSIQQWLHLASESQEGQDTSRAWCVGWSVVEPSQSDASVFNYSLAPQSREHYAKILPMSLPPTPVSVHSLSLSIARRIAIDLDLPFKARLANQSPLESGTSVEGQDLQDPQPEPEQLPVHGSKTNAPQDSQPEPPLAELRLPDEDSIVERLLTVSPSTIQPEASSDVAISLPSHLLLHFHILNEDFSLSSALPPVSALSKDRNVSSFTTMLQDEFSALQAQLKYVTQLGFTTSWGIGKRTQDVEWQRLEWQQERKRFEEVEMMEMRDVEYQEEQTDEHGSLFTRTLTRREPIKVKRNLTHIDWIPHSVNHLPSDQLEIFVDESGWDLTDRGSANASPSQEELANFPPLFDSPVTTSMHADQSQLKSLHFVIYNPAPEHQPLVYLGESEGDDQSQEELLRKAKQVDPSQHWGWIVPTWGGVVVHSNLTQRSFSSDLADKILPLIQDQLRLLIDLPASSLEPSSSHAHAQWHLFRRTIRTRTTDSISTLTATLNSLEKLRNLEIGPGVQSNVQAALSALDQLDVNVGVDSDHRRTAIDAQTFALSLSASLHASKAFHHPRMLGMLYFPAEHVYAVYTPLFGPLAVPLLLVGIKELKRISRERKARRRRRQAQDDDDDEGNKKSKKME